MIHRIATGTRVSTGLHSFTCHPTHTNFTQTHYARCPIMLMHSQPVDMALYVSLVVKCGQTVLLYYHTI